MNQHYIYELSIKLLHLVDQKQHKESEFFLSQLKENLLENTALNITELHVISCIGKNEPINVTALAEKMELSKGTISKISAKLIQGGWARKTQLNDNKKEIYLRLTPSGKKLFTVHEEYHLQAQNQIIHFIGKYNEAELEFLKRLLSDAILSLEASEFSQA